MSPRIRLLHFRKQTKLNLFRNLTLALSLCVGPVAHSSTELPAEIHSNPQSATTANANPAPSTITALTVPAGTNITLVLMHPLQSRYVHRGDPIYAQTTSPVVAGDQVAIPPGTFVQGTVEKLARQGGRAELTLQSLSITYPDGYVASVSGPITLQSGDGYALKDPGKGRIAALVAGPAAGAGLGALIGHSVAPSQGTTLTSSIPTGCTPGTPGCLSSSVTGPPDKGKDTVIGAAVGTGIGLAVGLVLVGSSHHFFLDVGAPIEMTLQRPLSLEGDQVAQAVHDAAQHPTPQQPIAPRPYYPPPPDNGTCWTPGTPGTSGYDIPGTPAGNGAPGTPPIHVPGTPGTPPTPYPCP
jgi:hypothetical protein